MFKLFKKYKFFIILGTIGLTFFLYKKFYKNNSDNNKWEVIVSPDYKPFCYLKNHEVTGLDIEILNEVAKIYGKKISIKITGFNFLFSHMQQNKSDIGAGGITITDERKQYNVISNSYLPLICGILMNKNLIVNKEFKGKIGLQTGSVFKEIISKQFPKAEIIEIEDFMFLLEAFQQKKLDVIAGDLIVLLDIKNKNTLLFKLKFSEGNSGTGFLLNKNINLNEFNKILEKVIKDNNKIKELKKKIENIPFFS